MIDQTVALWGGFTLFIVLMLALDLGVFQRKPHIISMKEALGWFGVWTGLALLFNVGIILFHERGTQAGLEFFTGFLVEKSLSIDNIFVFILIFGYFRVPQLYQHKVLFWGIVGAIVLRVAFIVGGLALMERFHWMIYLFGAFLLFTGITMMRKKEGQVNPEDNWVIRTFRRFFRVADKYDGNKFFTRRMDVLSPLRFLSFSSLLSLPTSFSRSTRFLRSLQSRRILFSFIRPIFLRCWACERSISPWRVSCAPSTSFTTALLPSF